MPPILTGTRIEMAHRVSQFLLSHPFVGAGLLASGIAKILMPPQLGRVRIRTAYGFELLVNPSADFGVQRPLYLFGTYEGSTLKLIRHCLRPGDTFVDVGSNIGLMSVLASRVVGPKGTVYSFEPEPGLHKQLLENLGINQSDNVHPFPFAIGSARAKSELYLDSRNMGHTSLMPPTLGSTSGIGVEVRALDELAISLNIRTMRMIKIDVEGWELEVLIGARRVLGGEQAPIMSIECSRLHPLKGGTVEDLLEAIKATNDYSVFRWKRGIVGRLRLVPVHTESDLPHDGNLCCFLPSHLAEVPRLLFS